MSLEWHTQESFSGEKNLEWYLAVSIIVIAIVTTSIIFGNVLLAIIIGVGFVALILAHRKGPQDINVSVTGKGIRLNDYVYTFENLESFNIDEDHDLLILKSKKFFSQHIVIPINESVSVDDLEKILSGHLKIEEMHESIFVRFMEYLGF